MKLKIKASAVKMSCDQWVELVHTASENEIIVRSCGQPETLWTVKALDIIGLQLSDNISIHFGVGHFRSPKTWSKT